MSRSKMKAQTAQDVIDKDSGAVAVAEASAEDASAAAPAEPADVVAPEAADPELDDAVTRVAAAHTELESRKARLAELRAAIDAAGPELERLDAQIAERVAKGEGAAALLGRRRNLRDEVADARHAVDLVEAKIAAATEALVAAKQAHAEVRLRRLAARRLAAAERADAAAADLVAALEEHAELRTAMQVTAREAGIGESNAKTYSRTNALRHWLAARLAPFLGADVDRPPAEAFGLTLLDCERRLFRVMLPPYAAGADR